MITINKVLVATDFSEASASALNYGREFARAFGARLYVLHVLDNAMMWVGPEAVGVDVGRLQGELENRAYNSLNRFITDEDRSQLKAETALRIGASPAVEIAEYAKSESIDLIVMGTHGRGPLGHLLMGSVAERAVRIAPCPVLTVHHPEHEFIAPDALQAVRAAGR
jgi:nucleotide-binding universal stress UspA family protein